MLTREGGRVGSENKIMRPWFAPDVRCARQKCRESGTLLLVFSGSPLQIFRSNYVSTIFLTLLYSSFGASKENVEQRLVLGACDS